MTDTPEKGQPTRAVPLTLTDSQALVQPELAPALTAGGLPAAPTTG